MKGLSWGLVMIASAFGLGGYVFGKRVQQDLDKNASKPREPEKPKPAAPT